MPGVKTIALDFQLDFRTLLWLWDRDTENWSNYHKDFVNAYYEIFRPSSYVPFSVHKRFIYRRTVTLLGAGNSRFISGQFGSSLILSQLWFCLVQSLGSGGSVVVSWEWVECGAYVLAPWFWYLRVWGQGLKISVITSWRNCQVKCHDWMLRDMLETMLCK